MIAGTREVATSNSMRHDPLYAYAKAFTEACNSILTTERYDIFQEPARAMRSEAVQEAMKEFFCNEVADETQMDAEDLEECKESWSEQFTKDIKGITENAYMSEYAPMVGMALPIHKLILMNNVFSQGDGIQKVTAVNPSFTISLERRILVCPDGTEIDFFLQQNQIADAIDATAPIVKINLTLPETGTTDIIAALGGGVQDELSTETKICGLLVKNVYFAEGDSLPVADEAGRLWFTSKGQAATAADAGAKDVWFRVDYPFTPNYGRAGSAERVLARTATIKYKTNAAGDYATITDQIYGSMDNNVITVTSMKGQITDVCLAAKLNTSNAMLDMCSVKWKVDTDYVEIPEATPINTTVSPEEVKDVAAMYNANQVTKIMANTKTALSEYKDKKILNFLNDSYDRLDERNGFYGTFDFAVPEGYALDWVTFRQATFMDYFDDLVTKMLQVLNDENMTISVFGDPRIVRKITPTDYVYQSPANIGPVTLDYTKTVVNSSDHRVYNFVGSDKLRGSNQLIVLLNPRNTERICYRIYDYQLYISNEIRNYANPALPAIHSFERFKMIEMFPVQSRIDILHPNGQKNVAPTF